ncbi:MAG: thiamine phosphate synthase [Myxococcota bacterium]
MSLPPLYVLLDVPTAERAGHDVRALAARILDAGASLVQLRDKRSDFDTFRRDASALAKIFEAYPEAHLLLNTHWELAAELGVGAHLTSTQLGSVCGVRASIAPAGLVGASTHDAAEYALAEQGADFVTVSPVFATASKPGYGPVLGLQGLGEACRASSIPVFALAGVTPSRAASCQEAGAHGVAVMGGVAGAEDPVRAVCAYVEVLTPPSRSSRGCGAGRRPCP